MQFLLNIAFITAKILIAIGDSVLILLHLLLEIVKKLLVLIEFLLTFITTFFVLIKLVIQNVFLLIKKIILLPFKWLIPKPIARALTRARSAAVFPLPFTIKLKYFTTGVLFSLFFLFIPVVVFMFIESLPNPKSMSLGQIPQTTRIYDRRGVLLYQIYASQNRTLVPLSEIPQKLQEATIAIEDKDFYKHPGFDITAIIRSLIENASGKGLQGGSTITQQLIKSALLTSETTLQRKLKEVILAFWAERIYTKKEIMELYFNQIPYGGTAWGVQAAANVYFGKNVRDLDLAESAFLAGIPKAPTIYSPFGTTPNAWKKRQKEVLQRMIALGYITKKDADDAASEELNFKTPQIPIHAPHFVMYIKDLLVKRYGLPMVEKGGLIVKTSLDLQLQEMAQKVVTDEVNNDAVLNLTNGAALITDPRNGDILAMVGSKDFSEDTSGNVNLTNSLRQPGSSIKIVTYSAALFHGFTSATMLDDSPVTFAGPPGAPPYSPVNYDGKFHGRVSLRMAFANSFNIPAVKTLNQIGIQTMVDLAKKMGIKTWNDPSRYGLSLTLGSGEVTMLDMATVYGVFPNEGVRIDLNPILDVTDYKGNVMEQKKEIIGQRVLDEGVTYIVSSILSDNKARALEFGTNSPLTIPGHTVSVKTGTSDNKRDNWTIGYTPSYLVAVWVGNNDNSPMSQSLASGITGAAPIWNKIMTNLIQNSPDQQLPVPTDITQKPCIGRTEYFIKGTESSVNCGPLPTASPSPKP